MGWRFPENCSFKELRVLLNYLAHESSSPLIKALVEIDDPYSHKIDTFMNYSFMCISSDKVPIAKIPLIKDQLLKTLRDIVEKEGGVDVDRMKIVIQEEISDELRGWEYSPRSQVQLLLLWTITNWKNEGPEDVI